MRNHKLQRKPPGRKRQPVKTYQINPIKLAMLQRYENLTLGQAVGRLIEETKTKT